MYRELPGWKRLLGSCRLPSELPPAARALIELVEEEVGAAQLVRRCRS
ncbi:MAG: hypothetical protein R2705_16265 [Ilumatobacteraceae bacterium]